MSYRKNKDYFPRENFNSSLKIQEEFPKNLTLQKTRTDIQNTKNPKLWGPSLWLFLHISSINYTPDSPERVKMCKEFILALPYMLPCNKCSEHAKQYVADHKGKLDTICFSRENLFKFYVDFHNYVNTRFNKRPYSYEEAWKMYSNGANILNFTF